MASLHPPQPDEFINYEFDSRAIPLNPDQSHHRCYVTFSTHYPITNHQSADHYVHDPDFPARLQQCHILSYFIILYGKVK